MNAKTKHFKTLQKMKTAGFLSLMLIIVCFIKIEIAKQNNRVQQQTMQQKEQPKLQQPVAKKMSLK